MKTNVIFCCNPKCRNEEIKSLIAKHQGEDIKVEKTNGRVFINNNVYILLIDINSQHEKLLGLELDGYGKCVEYTINPNVENILRMRIK